MKELQTNSECRASLLGFLTAAFVCVLPIIAHLSSSLSYLWESYWLIIILLFAIVQNGVLFAVYLTRSKIYQAAIRASILGLAFGAAVIISFSGTTFVNFGWYLAALSFFHWSEYVITALTNPKSLSLESYLLDHSREYKFAALASWAEYFIEWFIFPDLKIFHYITLIGVLLVISGEVLRKSSMLTAETNFNHYIQRYKQHGHVLVTNGAYALCRHPAYVGWFYWSVGTQLILCNPLCVIGYTMASWRFFNERIYEEEIYLLNFFGEDYLDYQKRVGTGLPFIQGYKGEL